MKCPQCKKETIFENNPNRPFCSERCQLIDLGEWAQESYRVPTEGSQSAESNPEDQEDHTESE